MRTLLDNLLAKPIWMLQDLGFRLMLEPPKRNSSRQHWAALIEEGIRSADIELLRSMMTTDEWKMLQAEAVYAPDNPDGWQLSFKALKRREQLQGIYDRLEFFGLAYRTRSEICILPEAVSAAMLNSEDGDESSYWLQLTDGVLRLVGCTPLAEFARIIDLSHDLWARANHIPSLTQQHLERIARLWQLRHGMNGVRLVDGQDIWLVAEQCEDPSAVLKAQLFGKGKHLKYPRLTPAQALLISSSENPIDRDKLDPILAYLARHGMEQETALDFLRRTTVLVQREEHGPAAELLGAAIPDNPSPSGLLQISEFFDQIPLWTLRGHSEAELHPYTLRKKPHARPDKLCSCGSGRLYHRCCGRLN